MGAQTRDSRLKLLSYNVQVGIPSEKYRHYLTNSWKHVLPFPERTGNLQRVAEFIADFDIVGLLELDAGSIRSEFIHQPEYVAEKAGFPYCYHRVNRDLGIVAQHSLAILSRYEASRVIQHSLPSRIPGRGALEVHFGTGEDTLIVVLAHLSLSSGARKRQLSYISKVIKPYRHVVVMGDLNSAISSSEIQSLLETSTLTTPATENHTYPSWKPRVAYDHILTTPEIRVGESEVFGFKYSDHLPVAMEVEFPGYITSKAS